MTTPEQHEMIEGEQDNPEPVTEEADPGTEYVEFVGDKQFGIEFTTSHVVTRKQLRDAWGVEIPKDLKWEKKQGGPNAGRMLIPVSDMTEEAAQGFDNDPMFRRVTLSN